MNKHNLYVTIILFFFFQISFSEPQLELELILDKTEFLKGELVLCGAQLTNHGGTIVTIPSLDSETYGLLLKVFDKNGKELKYTGSFHIALGQDRIALNPERSTFRLLDINSMYGKWISSASAHKYLEPGEYVIYIGFTVGMNQSLSSKATFKIINPTGEEGKAYDLFMTTLEQLGKGKIGAGEAADRFLTLETTYPQSVYTPIALSILPAWYQIILNDDRRSNETYKRLLEKYPSAAKIPGVLSSVLATIYSQSEKQEYLKNLKTEIKDRIGSLFMQKLVGKE